VQCSIIEKELPDTTDTPYYKCMRIKPITTNLPKYKLIIVGDSNVGKSTIVHRFSKGVYANHITNTTGTSFILQL